MQNHLMEILTLVAMELPSKQATINDVLRTKSNVLKNIAPLDDDSLLIGQYHEYPAEAEIELNRTSYTSTTPTFGAAVLYVDTPRWQGVPFVLMSGKKLDEKASYVRVLFKRSTPERVCLDKQTAASGQCGAAAAASSSDPHSPAAREEAI